MRHTLEMTSRSTATVWMLHVWVHAGSEESLDGPRTSPAARRWVTPSLFHPHDLASVVSRRRHVVFVTGAAVRMTSSSPAARMMLAHTLPCMGSRYMSVCLASLLGSAVTLPSDVQPLSLLQVPTFGFAARAVAATPYATGAFLCAISQH